MYIYDNTWLEYFLEWETFQTKVLEEINTHILCSITILFIENRSVYEITWKNMVERGRPQMAIGHMCIACWITKATDTHSDYVMKGKAVRLQAWSGPEGSRNLRFPDFMTTTQDGGKFVSLTHLSPLPPGNTPGSHFC